MGRSRQERTRAKKYGQEGPGGNRCGQERTGAGKSVHLGMRAGRCVCLSSGCSSAAHPLGSSAWVLLTCSMAWQYDSSVDHQRALPAHTLVVRFGRRWVFTESGALLGHSGSLFISLLGTLSLKKPTFQDALHVAAAVETWVLPDRSCGIWSMALSQRFLCIKHTFVSMTVCMSPCVHEHVCMCMLMPTCGGTHCVSYVHVHMFCVYMSV